MRGAGLPQHPRSPVPYRTGAGRSRRSPTPPVAAHRCVTPVLGRPRQHAAPASPTPTPALQCGAPYGSPGPSPWRYPPTPTSPPPACLPASATYTVPLQDYHAAYSSATIVGSPVLAASTYLMPATQSAMQSPATWIAPISTWQSPIPPPLPP
eukprot:EG_transcript_36602